LAVEIAGRVPNLTLLERTVNGQPASPRSMEGSATLTMLASNKIMNAANCMTANARQRRGSATSRVQRPTSPEPRPWRSWKPTRTAPTHLTNWSWVV
jgi:hypothetical protein